jgi:uncharacterized protein YegL
MSTWSHKRQLVYLAIPLCIILIISGYFFFKYGRVAPSCFDGTQNGTETGVDCGGSCSLLCTGDSLDPVVLWSQSFLVDGSVWNAGAYVQNPNTFSVSTQVPYEFKLYNTNNILITTVTGETYIPKNKKFLVFHGGIDTKGQTVKRTEFRFTDPIVWKKTKQIDTDFLVTHNPLEKASTTPAILGTIENNTPTVSRQTELSVIIYDGKQNAIGISRTYVDPLSPRTATSFGFTWLKPFKTTEIACTVPSDVMLVLDRSGSMASISQNPPEPLSSVKNTAISFVSSLRQGDQSGVVSFATSPSEPIDQRLSSDVSRVIQAINAIAIATTSIQNTNIGDGLASAQKELFSDTAHADANKIIILLTDGEPTDPKKIGDTQYPTTYALTQADSIKQTGVSVFTIGLGSLVNTELLTRIASTPYQFFGAPQATDLSAIYKKISSSICTIRPNVIEVISNELPQ